MAITARLRFEVFKRDGFRCVYCGIGPEGRLELEHRRARANGGDDTRDNLTTACFLCNRGKADIPLDRRDELPVEIAEKVAFRRGESAWYIGECIAAFEAHLAAPLHDLDFRLLSWLAEFFRWNGADRVHQLARRASDLEPEGIESAFAAFYMEALASGQREPDVRKHAPAIFPERVPEEWA